MACTYLCIELRWCMTKTKANKLLADAIGAPVRTVEQFRYRKTNAGTTKLALAALTAIETGEPVALGDLRITVTGPQAEPKEEPFSFRYHRRTLVESLETTVTLPSVSALLALLDTDRRAVGVTPKGFDERCGWDTHIVTVDGEAVGFVDRAINLGECAL